MITLNDVYKTRNHYKVLVKTITFNHSKYIRDTLNGIAMQITNFPFVNVVLEDHSTDGEQEVIKTWMEQECDLLLAEYYDIPTAEVIIAPHKSNANCTFAVYFHKENLFRQKAKREEQVNPWRTNSEYEAMCEGDDYWTDPFKLQKQVDFMDANPEYGLVWGKALCLIHEQQKFEGTVGGVASSFDDLLNNNAVCTLTALYRAESSSGYNQLTENQSWLLGDYPLWLYISSKSKIHFMNEQFAVYRILTDSASHSKSYSKRIAFLESIYDIKYFFLEYTGRQLTNDLIENKTCQAFDIAFNCAEYSWAINLFKEIPYKKRSMRKYIKYIISLLMALRIRFKS